MTSKKHIIIVSGKNPLTSSGGYAAYAKTLAKTLTHLGHTVTIYCMGKKSQRVQTAYASIIVCGNPLLAFPIFQSQTMVGFPLFSLQMAYAMYKNKTPITVWGIGPWSLTGAIYKHIFRRKTILLADYFTSIKHEFQGRVIGMPFGDYGVWKWLENKIVLLALIPFYSLLEYILLPKVDKIITHYRSTEKILRSEFGLKKSTFTRLPYAITSPNRTKKRMSKTPTLLLVGRQDGRKGVNVFLHACKLLEEKEMRFRTYIIGTGELESANKHLANKLKLQRVTFIGYAKNVTSYVTTQTIFVLPSLEEGSSSISLLEAMAQGMCVVASNIDGIPEDVAYNSGLLVHSNSPYALAKTLQQVLSNSTKAKLLGKNARQIVWRKHGMSKSKKALRQLLATL